MRPWLLALALCLATPGCATMLVVHTFSRDGPLRRVPPPPARLEVRAAARTSDGVYHVLLACEDHTERTLHWRLPSQGDDGEVEVVPGRDLPARATPLESAEGARVRDGVVLRGGVLEAVRAGAIVDVTSARLARSPSPWRSLLVLVAPLAPVAVAWDLATWPIQLLVPELMFGALMAAGVPL